MRSGRFLNGAAMRFVTDAKRVLGRNFKQSVDIGREDLGPFKLNRVMGSMANMAFGRKIAEKFMNKSVYRPIQ